MTSPHDGREPLGTARTNQAAELVARYKDWKRARARIERRFTFIAGAIFVVAGIAILVISFDHSENKPSIPEGYVALGLAAVGPLLMTIGEFRLRVTEASIDHRPLPPELDPRYDFVLPDVADSDVRNSDAAVNAELLVVQRIARYRADAARTSANHWWLVRYWFGIPATALAGLAGITSLVEVSRGWQVAVGVLALLGSALAAATTAMDPARNEASARQRSALYEDLATRARLNRHLGPEGSDKMSKADVYALYQELQLLGAASLTRSASSEETIATGVAEEGAQST